MPTQQESLVNAPAVREVVLTRIYDAPRELVFKAWTEPAHLAEWWGPQGFDNPVCRTDGRVGGNFLIHMRAPDGSIYPCTGEYYEVVEPERIVMSNDALDAATGTRVLKGLTTVTFESVGKKTKLTVTAKIIEAAPGMEPALDGMKTGWMMSLDKLTGLLEIAAREILTSRLVNAPRDLVFEAWTDPKHLAHWFGPNGFTITTHAMDFRPGGAWVFVMHGPDGTDYNNKVVYVEIARPERLIYIHGDGNDGDPGTFTTTTTFEELDGKTLVTMRGRFPSAAERELVEKQHHAVEGAQQTIARLAAYAESR